VQHSVDLRSRESGAEAVVDINHGDATAAAIEHAEQGRKAIEAGAVADAGRHGNYRFGDKPGDRAGKGAFHSCDDNEDVARLETIAFSEKAMDARDTHIDDSFHPIAKEFKCNGRFFRNRQIRRAGANHPHSSVVARQSFALDGDAAGADVPFRHREFSRDGAKMVFGGAAYEQHRILGENRATDGEDIFWRFTIAVDDLWESAPTPAVCVDAREAEIDEGNRHQGFEPGSVERMRRMGIIEDSKKP
jgi:hypothetical protein